MKAFNKVREDCFGINLNKRYKNSINDFANFMLKCDRSITLKCHILFVHVPQFLDLKKDQYPDKGLGFWAEHALESCHSLWKKFWSHRKVPPDHPKYHEILFWALVEFNGGHYGNFGD